MRFGVGDSRGGEGGGGGRGGGGEREREESVFRVSCGACWTVALALLFAGGVTTGDAYLFHRLGGFSGGVSLDEPLLPASSLTRNTRNTQVQHFSAKSSTFQPSPALSRQVQRSWTKPK